MRLSNFFLAALLFFSVLLRLVDLGRIPNGLTVDEADMGYNAYSILKTGKDVYGRSFPMFFQSLDDYKPGFAIYASIPAIRLLGLSEYSIRLFPAIIGALTPLLFFVFLKMLYPKNNYAAFSVFLLTTFAPWNVAISRATFMYIELVFFLLLALITFFLGIKNKNFPIYISACIFAFTLYVYYAALIYIPLIGIILFIFFKKELLAKKKNLIIASVLFLVISAPALSHYLNGSARSRFNAISLFTPDISLPVSIQEIETDNKSNNKLFNFYHNRRIINVSNTLDNYFDYLNMDYLFVNSKNIRYFYINYYGLFYFLEFPFLLIALHKIIKKRESNDLFLLALLLISPIPAAITLGSPFVHRAILLPMVLQILIALGLAKFLKSFQASYFQKPIYYSIAALYLISAVGFIHQYFVHNPKEFSTEKDNGAWFSSVKEAIPQLNLYKQKYPTVVFTWSSTKLVPGIYYLFYSKIDPTLVQNKSAKWTNESPSFRQIYNEVGNVQFRPIDWKADSQLKNTLFIGYPSDFQKDDDIHTISKTYDQDGKEHFWFVTKD
ncbi:glycosyltransferase family 39 protein [Candidatus Curtissbacteria bacterium]|nr:glycosyltransferase family 39 protein [Candidatus Curtissbacteria bacterium]